MDALDTGGHFQERRLSLRELNICQLFEPLQWNIHCVSTKPRIIYCTEVARTLKQHQNVWKRAPSSEVASQSMILLTGIR